jgi:uncharacterized protein YukE
MGVGRMSYTEATTCADNLNRYSANIEKYLTDLRTEINSMDEVLKSEGANELLARYDELDKKLVDCPVKITEFENHLRTAIRKYQEDDQRLREESK